MAKKDAVNEEEVPTTPKKEKAEVVVVVMSDGRSVSFAGKR